MSAPIAAGRKPCPVATCTRDMPAADVMCSHCWSTVDRAIRVEIGRLKNGNQRRQALIAAAVNQAAVFPAGAP